MAFTFSGRSSRQPFFAAQLSIATRPARSVAVVKPVLPALERESLAQWTQAAFREAQGIIFVAACGIAVRAMR